MVPCLLVKINYNVFIKFLFAYFFIVHMYCTCTMFALHDCIVVEMFGLNFSKP